MWVSMENFSEEKKVYTKKSLLLFGLCLGTVAIFMYVSFIFKVAINGP